MRVDKVFTPTTVPHEGRRVRGFTVSCGHCGISGSVPVNTFKGHSDDREIRSTRQKLELKGWKIGKSIGQHRCPGCFSKAKFSAIQKSKEAKMNSNVTPLKPPAEMSREDRRIIFEKINDVYQDEKSGYSSGWTDLKVSQDLNTPLAWVTQIRADMFGPEGSNPEIRTAIAEAQALLTSAKAIGAKVEPIVAELRTIAMRADKIEKTMLEIQRAVR